MKKHKNDAGYESDVHGGVGVEGSFKMTNMARQLGMSRRDPIKNADYSVVEKPKLLSRESRERQKVATGPTKAAPATSKPEALPKAALPSETAAPNKRERADYMREYQRKRRAEKKALSSDQDPDVRS